MYVALAVLLVWPVVQFQSGTIRRVRKFEQGRRQFEQAHRCGAISDTQQAHRCGAISDTQPAPKFRPKGAVTRWRSAVREFWRPGTNIYRATPDDSPSGWLHPNMPFTVILMTPLAHLPIWAAALAWNVLKALVVVAAVLMTASLANHSERRMPDWVLALGVVWATSMIVGDIQHGNTNCFVLGAVVLHLWLFRRGGDALAGVPLALAICLKMTPALFVLYWLYQRNWKLLGGVLAALAVFTVVVPAAAVGPERAMTLTGTWLENLIVPGLVKGSWYPVHTNQSIPGLFSRYFIGRPNPGGNIFWHPDNVPDPDQAERFGWITIVAMSPGAVKLLVRAAQAVVVALAAWAIGWRRLPRRDGRRCLHYGIILLGMMLLNQRTWDHHAAVLLPAYVAVWHAIVLGRPGRGARRWAMGLMLAAGGLVWLTRTDMFKALGVLSGRGKDVGAYWGDLCLAYGSVFYHFVLVFAALVVMAVALRTRSLPYATRQA